MAAPVPVKVTLRFCPHDAIEQNSNIERRVDLDMYGAVWMVFFVKDTGFIADLRHGIMRMK